MLDNNNRKLKIFDKDGTNDKCSVIGTDVILTNKATGKVIFRDSNKVIVSGSEFNALKDFTFSNYSTSDDFASTIPNYDTALENNNHALIPGKGTTRPQLYPYTQGILGSLFDTNTEIDKLNEDKKAAYKYLSRRVNLFCVGIDGCGLEASRVFKVQNTKWIAPWGYANYNNGNGTTITDVENCLIPFKYRTSNADLTDTNRETYFGRSIDNTNNISYYFKGFDATPQLIRRYADDSADLEGVDDVWKDTRTSEAETVVQLKMSISNTDCREYFNTNFGLSSGRINTISLCSSIPCVYKDNGVERLEYIDIRPFTKFNFPNESLVDYSKGIGISYYLYY